MLRGAKHLATNCLNGAALGCFAVLVSTARSHASSVVPMTLETLADHAGQVIVGRVAAVRCYWAASPRRIESEVVFEQVEYLKGALPTSEPEFRLAVPGGVIGETQMRIGCAPAFAVGEKWLLFFLPTYKTFPVVGLSQGAIRVVAAADGVERVHSSSGMAIAGIDERRFIKTAEYGTVRAPANVHASGSARVVAEPLHAGEAQALTLEEFLALVRPILARSRDHRLTEPAGRRMSVSHQGVPIRPAPAPMPDPAWPNKRRGLDAVQRLEADARGAEKHSQGTGQ